MNNVYGYCPRCGELGMSRERRLNGNDRCENGHSYPSSTSVANPLLPVVPATEHTADTERAAVVAYLRSRHGYGPVADAIERGEHRREEER